MIVCGIIDLHNMSHSIDSQIPFIYTFQTQTHQMNLLFKNQSMLIPNNISTIRATIADEECILSSAGVTSASPSNWWPDNHHHVHATSLPSWAIDSTNPNWSIQNPNSSYSSGEEDLSMSTSFTNASDHSTRRVDDQGVPANELLIGENPSDHNHLWNHVLLSAGNCNEELHHNQDVGDDLIHAFSSKSLSNGLFQPACDYLKKIDNGWDIPNSAPFRTSDGYNNSMFEAQRLTNWSLAPPDPEISSRQFNPLSCNISLSPTTIDQYSNSSKDMYYLKPSTANPKLKVSYLPHEYLKSEKEQAETETNVSLLRRSIDSNNGMRYQMGTNNGLVGDDSKFYNSISDIQCNSNGRDIEHVPHSGNYLSKPWMNIKTSKPILKSLNISDCKKQASEASHMPTISTCNTVIRSNRKGLVLANEGKKKRSSEQVDTALKKPKHESSIVSSAKIQVPKAKLGGKITALQQIVSPFGKTDTASVLWEAVNYIKFLQEQVQLLSNPYMQTSTMKDPWGGMDRKDRGHVEVDLRSRGLCLVPVSCTPQAYRENNGPDYLTPAYRGSLYR